MALYSKIVSVIFALIAILHALRIAHQWEASIGGWNVPMWLSVPAFIVAVALSVFGYVYSYKSYKE